MPMLLAPSSFRPFIEKKNLSALYVELFTSNLKAVYDGNKLQTWSWKDGSLISSQLHKPLRDRDKVLIKSFFVEGF